MTYKPWVGSWRRARRKTESLSLSLSLLPPLILIKTRAETRWSFCVGWARCLVLVKVGPGMRNVLIMPSLAPVLPGLAPLSSCSECHSVSESHKMRVFLLLPLLLMSHIRAVRWHHHNPSRTRQIKHSNTLHLIFLQQLGVWAILWQWQQWS